VRRTKQDCRRLRLCHANSFVVMALQTLTASLPVPSYDPSGTPTFPRFQSLMVDSTLRGEQSWGGHVGLETWRRRALSGGARHPISVPCTVSDCHLNWSASRRKPLRLAAIAICPRWSLPGSVCCAVKRSINRAASPKNQGNCANRCKRHGLLQRTFGIRIS
jgi:hypothetical protein